MLNLQEYTDSFWWKYTYHLLATVGHVLSLHYSAVLPPLCHNCRTSQCDLSIFVCANATMTNYLILTWQIMFLHLSVSWSSISISVCSFYRVSAVSLWVLVTSLCLVATGTVLGVWTLTKQQGEKKLWVTWGSWSGLRTMVFIVSTGCCVIRSLSISSVSLHLY